MSEHSERIKNLRLIFEQSKTARRDKEGRIEDMRLSGDLIDALMDVAEDKMFELKDEIYCFIHDPDSCYRELAVRCLGGINYFRLEEFRDTAYEIWLKDPCLEVKYTALDAWVEYYGKSYNPMILKYLYNILKSNIFDLKIKSIALYGFFNVVNDFKYPLEGWDILNYNKLKDHEAFNKAADWSKVNRIMKEYVFDRKNISQIKEKSLPNRKK